MSGRKQHIIPKKHLKHFAGHDPKGHVWTYDATADEPRSATPANTAVETHFYSIQMEDGTMDPTMDNFVTNVEGKAAPIYEDVIDGRIPEDGLAKANFSAYLVLMYFRTTAVRRFMAELYGQHLQLQAYATAMHEGSFKNYIEKKEKKTGREIPKVEKELIRHAMLNPGEYFKLNVPKEKTLIAILEGYRFLIPILVRMKWSVGEAEQGYLITSDNPVMRRIKSDTHHPLYGDHGFFNRTAQVTFPLSPKRLLVLTWEDSSSQIFPIGQEYINDQNQARAAHSDRYLYAHMQDRNLMEMALRFKDSRLGISRSGFGPEKFAEVRVPRKWNQ